MLGSLPPTNANSYLIPWPKSNDLLPSAIPVPKMLPGKKLPLFNKTKLLYYMSQIINVHCLYIFSSVFQDIFAIIYREGYTDFDYYYEIITYF